jgi:HprK-related kinase A
MKVGDFEPDDFLRCLCGRGVSIRSGPFITHVVSELKELARPVHTLYAEFPIADGDFANFHVRLQCAPGMYRRLRGQIIFTMDWETAFHPLPRKHALPLLESGMSWCMYRNSHQYLIIHAAVIQKDAVTCILPGTSGAGKSTLCAALVSKGWRLFSDELAILRLDHGAVMPITKPISLKNESISLMQEFAPDQVFVPCFGNTRKGAVAHMRPPTESVHRMDEESFPTHIIFPAYHCDEQATLDPVPKARAFYRLADCCLNYHVLGQEGFQTLADLIDCCTCFAFGYASLDDAVRVFDGIT